MTAGREAHIYTIEQKALCTDHPDPPGPSALLPSQLVAVLETINPRKEEKCVCKCVMVTKTPQKKHILTTYFINHMGWGPRQGSSKGLMQSVNTDHFIFTVIGL